ncbi:MAG: oligoendopeptidase F [Eubacteriales bacterium]|nr:oligoendopeptidase F [Eubacteriales bacterium]
MLYFEAKEQNGNVQKMLKREEVDPALTWDLSPLYPSLDSWEADFTKLRQDLPELSNYAGRLGESAELLQEFLQRLELAGRKLSKLYSYASMRSDQDKGNSENSAILQRAAQLSAEFSAAVSFKDPELLELGQEKLAEMLEKEPELKIYQHQFERLLRSKEHLLSASEEQILAASAEVLNSGAEVFSALNNADLSFPDVHDSSGQALKLNHASFARYLESSDRVLRENAFKQYYSVYEQFQNTLAMTLSRQIKKDNLTANLRGFPNARAAAIFPNAIDEAVPAGLIETVNENLDLLHRYVALKKKLSKLEDFHSYDLYLPAFQSEERLYSLDEAREIITAAVAPLGAEYQNLINRAFKERWLDLAVNQGKRSGAYSGGCYDSNPYILMSWQGSLANLFTLTHELGHSCHSYYSRSKQPYIYGRYSIFLAEIASTTNENLLTRYLLEEESDPELVNHLRFTWLDRFKSTVFRQTQFAEFEHQIHLADQSGQALSAEYLNQEYAELNQRYYGKDLLKDEEIRLEWARIPHFYYNYYVYQYASGFCAAVSFADLLLESEGAREAYLGYLSAGSSDYPLEVLNSAGLDMRKPDTVNKAVKRFARELSELEEISSK